MPYLRAPGDPAAMTRPKSPEFSTGLTGLTGFQHLQPGISTESIHSLFETVRRPSGVRTPFESMTQRLRRQSR